MSVVVAVIQARMSSQRLPGKVLAELGGATVIDWVLERTGSATSLADVVVATSTAATDDALVEHCRRRGHQVVRGSLDDVLDRVYSAAVRTGAEHVVRITGDCPLVDGAVIDTVVATHIAHGNDFTANRLPPPHRRTFPVGLDVEVATGAALRAAWAKASEAHHREHVMPYLYEVPGRFRVEVVDAAEDAGSVRWTVDTPADLAAVRGLVTAAAADVQTSWQELLRVWRRHPELAELNGAVVQRAATHVDERTRFDLPRPSG